MMTNQDIYDKVKAHLLKQGKRAVNIEGCRYRAEDGSMCAAGCLIPDTAYTPELEGRLVNGMEHRSAPVHEALFAGGVGEESIPLVAKLQMIHDNFSESPAVWPQRLASCAILHGLTP